MDAFKDVETTELHPATKRRLARMAKSAVFTGVFHPGSAGAPPLLAGRQAQAERINRLLNELTSEPAAPRDIHAVTLHGPRGAGKTVLLDIVRRSIASSPSKTLGVISIGGAELASAPNLLDAVLAQMPADSVRTQSESGKLGVPGIALASLSTSSARSSGPASQGLFKDVVARYAEVRGQCPLFIVDEAHAANPEAVGVMLSALQNLNGGGLPCGAILAGTPDLVDVLRRAEATWYLDRNKEARLIPVGAISDADCALAVKAPLDAMGIEHDSHALAEAAQWCSGNAYFTQALGAAALEAVAGNASIKADFRQGGPVWTRFSALAHDRYGEAWQNLAGQGLTGCARQLGTLWRWAKGDDSRLLYSDLVEGAVGSGLRNPPINKTPKLSEDEAHLHFLHLGLLWSPSARTEGPWELGLPSFFDFVEERYRDPRWQHYNKTLNALTADESTFIPEAPTSEGDLGGS